MANSPFEIKSRINYSTLTKMTPANSPLSRTTLRSPLKSSGQQTSLTLQTIIGTTTTSPSGLSCHYDSTSFAYCAGSVAVLATVDDRGEISSRFFRAHPNATPMNPYVSYYNPSTPTSTPESRRRAILSLKHGTDERMSNNSPRRTWGDDGSSKAWSARERVKALSCLHLSPNGRFLAVGETGYNPRVNIFSTAPGASTDIPLATLTEHTFGVRCLAFSPNSRWLATLGDANDGFLFIWSINPKTGAAKLYCTNKCTASVLDMAWCANTLITVGTRYVKVWRVGGPSSGFPAKPGRALLESDGSSSPAPKTLAGRNCRLGSLSTSTFTCVSPISDYEAILCTTGGAVCLLDDRAGMQELKCLRQLTCPIQSAAVDFERRRIWFATSEGYFDSESVEKLKKGLDTGTCKSDETTAATSSPSSAITESCCSPQSPTRSAMPGASRGYGAIASCFLPNRIVSIDEERNIRIEFLADEAKAVDSKPASPSTLQAHNEAVYGVIAVPKQARRGDFLTWSLGGAVNFWSLDGSMIRSEKVVLEQPDELSEEDGGYRNELRVIRMSPDSQYIISGDRLGVVQLISCQSWQATPIRAHSVEITDAAFNFSDEALLVATSSRDRTVQLLRFQNGNLELLQTFDDHVGAVSAVSLVDDFLISASADRTVIVRQRLSRPSDDRNNGAVPSMAYVPKRVITLKASPTSMSFPGAEVMVVATMDRQVLSFSIETGQTLDGFKAFDAEGEDAVVLNSLTISGVEHASGSRRILTSFSSSDKSVRLYDLDRGVLLARELGHTEGISDVAVLEDAEDSTGRDMKTIISTGLDGLIMVWHASMAQSRLPTTPLQELSQGHATGPADVDSTPTKDSILRRPPLRKVLSKLALADMASLKEPLQSPRDESPSRLKKKPSTYSLCIGKSNGVPAQHSPVEIAPEGQELAQADAKAISSPSTAPNSTGGQTTPCDDLSAPSISAGLASPASRMIENAATVRSRREEGSPSPPPPSLPVTPKAVNRANKGRLRRPPSVPADLRGQSFAPARRKSMGNVNDFGSIGMASEQVCRTLRAYRNKIKAAPRNDRLQLEELEVELVATLRAVEQRREQNGSRRAKAVTEKDLDSLATLLETSRLDAPS